MNGWPHLRLSPTLYVDDAAAGAIAGQLTSSWLTFGSAAAGAAAQLL
ncbi:hypothetical protein [Kribbella sp. CA-294648]